ncbi:MAG TPA: DNA-binding protein [Bosea sp. (in: a-proteobacteria)]|jgi:cellobiose-specific phosphotransferase system component IIA|nr:DNA-binding protein [Bosea sp. (in: a-proteobacteria)]
MSDNDQNQPTIPPFAGAPAENESVEARHVHAACDALDAQGKKPTFDAIRELLGKGSFSTISQYLRTWVPKRLDFAPPLPEPLAEAGQEFATEFWRQAILCATSQLVLERQTAKETLDEALAAIRVLEAQVEAGEVRLGEASAKLEEAAGKLRAAHHQQMELRDKLTRSEGELRLLHPLMERLQIAPVAGEACRWALNSP